MARRTASSDSQSRPAQKPFVRSEDISDTGWLIGIISVVLIFGIMIAFASLFDYPDQFPPGVLLVIVGAPSAVFWGASYLLVRRKYGLPWSEVGLTFHNWQRGLLWAVGLFPLALLACWLEDLGWRWLLYRHSIPFLSPWQSPLDSLADWGTNDSVIALSEMVIAIIVVVITQGVFFWGMGYNAIERRMSSVLAGIFNFAFALLLAYLWGFPFLLCLPFVAACVITFAYARTRTLLTPLTMTIALLLSVLFVLQPGQYAVDRFTIHGNCICAEDGTPLSNDIVTFDGVDYQNVTVVKWSAGSAVGEGEAKTSSSGAYTLNVRRGYNLKLMVTSTHYHRHGTGPDATLKKCTYSYTETLGYREVEDSTKTVERNFSVAPDTFEELSNLQE